MQLRFLSALCALVLLTAPSPAQTTSAGEEPLGEVFASDASVHGSVVFAGSGTSLLPGSTVDAGSHAALVKLKRGGEVRVCPGSSVSMTLSPGERSQRGLVLSMGTGAVEADYSLSAAADSIVTPDFRILLAGPASFHVAISADAQGNTCVRTRSGNSGAVVVSELMGGGVYQVKASEAVLFRLGKVSGASPAGQECGCPPPVAPQELALGSQPAGAATLMPGSETQPPPAPKPGEVEVEVSAPFVFHAAEPAPPDIQAIAALHLQLQPAVPSPEVLPPPPPAAASALPPKEEHPGFFAKLRGFFASLFGKKSKVPDKPAAATMVE